MHVLSLWSLLFTKKHISKFLVFSVDSYDMIDKSKKFKVAERCLYLKVCYLAEELKCFGYKTDCALYQKSNNEKCSEQRFNDAMNKLINVTMLKYQDEAKK